MSVTRTPLCRVKVCPHPSDPWYHVCAVCEAPAVHHHHNEPKGMGGSKERDVKENIVMLCAIHHMEEHGIGASSAAVEVPDSGSGADASAVAPDAPASTGSGEEKSSGLGAQPVQDAASREGSPLPAGASRGLPEETTERTSDGRLGGPGGQDSRQSAAATTPLGGLLEEQE